MSQYYRSLIQSVVTPSVNWTNLIHAWKFNSSPNDSIGSENATLVNSPTYTSGKLSDCLSLNGIDQYAKLASNNSVLRGVFAGSFSIFSWAYFDSANGSFQILFDSVDNSFKNVGLFFYLNKAYFSYYDGISHSLSGTVDLSTGWHLLVGVHTASVGSKLYCDNVLIASNSDTVNVTLSGANDTSFGAYNPTYPLYFGLRKIDFTGIFNVDIDATRVSEIWNAGIGIEN